MVINKIILKIKKHLKYIAFSVVLHQLDTTISS